MGTNDILNSGTVNAAALVLNGVAVGTGVSLEAQAYATAAATSATEAAASAAAASSSASVALASSSSASVSEVAAALSETNAATSETNAAASEASALAHLNEFKGIYLGVYAANPTVDSLGNPINQGDWYFNSSDSTTYIYDGAGFVVVASTGSIAYATTATSGLVQLATDAEAQAGTETSHAVVSSGLKAHADANGFQFQNQATKVITGAYTVIATDSARILQANSSLTSVTFPDTSADTSYLGKVITIILSGTVGGVTFNSSGSQNIYYNGIGNLTTSLTTHEGSIYTLVGTGYGWQVINSEHTFQPDAPRAVWTGTATSVAMSSLSDQGPGFYIISVAGGQDFSIYLRNVGTYAYGTSGVTASNGTYGVTTVRYAYYVGATQSFEVIEDGTGGPTAVTLNAIWKL